jgi:hypothetical protein
MLYDEHQNSSFDVVFICTDIMKNQGGSESKLVHLLTQTCAQHGKG